MSRMPKLLSLLALALASAAGAQQYPVKTVRLIRKGRCVCGTVKTGELTGKADEARKLLTDGVPALLKVYAQAWGPVPWGRLGR